MTFGGSLVLREDGLTIQLWVEHLAAPFMAPYDQLVHMPNIVYMSFLSSGIFAKKFLSKLSHSL